jgi:hypothetical protein
MIRLFLALTVLNVLCLSITTFAGYSVSSGHHWSSYHQLAGALSTIICCAVHCVVFTYFTATSNWVQHALLVKNLDLALAMPTRSFKAQALPAALIAIAVVFVTAVTGAATFSYRISPTTHHILALLSLATNIVCAMFEYRAISRNGRLIDTVLAAIDRCS